MFYKVNLAVKEASDEPDRKQTEGTTDTMKRRDDRDEEVKPIARQIEQLARAPTYAPRGYRIGDYGNHTARRCVLGAVKIVRGACCEHALRSRGNLAACSLQAPPAGNSICWPPRK